jgi:serine/threonine protein kinase
MTESSIKRARSPEEAGTARNKRARTAGWKATARTLLGKDVGEGRVLKKFVGKGAFGFVFSVVGRDTVIKVVKQSTTVTREVSVLSAIGGNRNIINLIRDSAFTHNGELHVAMEFERYDCDLHFYIQKRRSIDLQTAIMFTAQILSGLADCHSKGILHRDIKPENILVRKDIVAISDFGGSIIQKTPQTELPCRVITLPYRPPELIQAGKKMAKYGGEIDIWSLGCVFSEMLTGLVMFTAGFGQGDDEFQLTTLRQQHAYFACTKGETKGDVYLRRKVPDPVLQAWKSLLLMDPSARPTAETARNLWFTLNAT